jgi:hypothetical protein
MSEHYPGSEREPDPRDPGGHDDDGAADEGAASPPYGEGQGGHPGQPTKDPDDNGGTD